MKQAVTAAALTAAAAVLWGTSFVANDLGLREVDAPAFTAARFLLAAASAWLVLLLVDRRAALRPPWRESALWLFGALNAGAFLLQYLGQERTTPARAALFINANVFTVALLQLAYARERPTRGTLASATVALAGVLLLTTGGDPASLLGGRLLGDLLTFAGGAAWALYIVRNKAFLARHGPLAAVTWTFVATAILLLPFLALGEPPAGPVGWTAIAYTGLLCTTAAYLLWSYGLRRLTPTTSSVVLLLEVPAAAALSLALALEGFTAWTAAGALLLFAGVAGATTAEAKKEKAATQRREGVAEMAAAGRR